MVQAAQGDKDPELRLAAIRNLGLMGKSDALQGHLRKRIRPAREKKKY